MKGDGIYLDPNYKARIAKTGMLNLKIAKLIKVTPVYLCSALSGDKTCRPDVKDRLDFVLKTLEETLTKINNHETMV